MQRDVHALAREKGWWDEAEPLYRTSRPGRLAVNEILAKLALIHSEVSEATECVRKGEIEAGEFWANGAAFGKPIGLPSELADIVIRTMDLAEALGIDLGRAILEKHDYNKTRPHRHGGKLA